MASWAAAHALRERSWLLEWPRLGEGEPRPGEALLACRPGCGLGFLCAAQPAEGLRPVLGTAVRARPADVPGAGAGGELRLGGLRLLRLEARAPRAVRLAASGPAAGLGGARLLRLLRHCPFLAAGSVVELSCGLVHVSGDPGEGGGAVLMLTARDPEPPVSLASAEGLGLLAEASLCGALRAGPAAPEPCHIGHEAALAEFAAYLQRRMLRGVLVCGPAGSGRDGFVARGLREAGCEALWLRAGDLLLADRAALAPLRDALGGAYAFWAGPEGRPQHVLPAYDRHTREAVAQYARGRAGEEGGPAPQAESPRPAFLRELFRLAGEWARARPGRRLAVVLRDADELFPPRAGAREEQRELSSTLLALMDGAGGGATAGAEPALPETLPGEGPGAGAGAAAAPFTLVGICADPSRLDLALRRPGRFEAELELRLPGREARTEMVRAWLGLGGAAPHGAPAGEGLRPLLEAAADATSGCCGSDIRAMAAEALEAVEGPGEQGEPGRPAGAAEALSEPPPELPPGRPPGHPDAPALLRGFLRAARAFRPSASRVLQFYVEPPAPAALRHLAPLFDRQLAALSARLLMPVLHPRLYERAMGPSRRRGGTLICGPAGSGKTTFVRRLCAGLAGKFSFFEVKCGAIYSKYVGESEANLRRAFREARGRTPSVLVLDDFDVLVGGRREDSAREDSVSGRVLGTLLTELDGLYDSGGLFAGALHVLAVTRDPGRLDLALTRCGRFDDRLALGPACGGRGAECGPAELGAVLGALVSGAAPGEPAPGDTEGLARELCARPEPRTIGALSSWVGERASGAGLAGSRPARAELLGALRESLARG